MLVTPKPERLGYIRTPSNGGLSVRESPGSLAMDPWFLYQLREITLAQMGLAQNVAQ